MLEELLCRFLNDRFGQRLVALALSDFNTAGVTAIRDRVYT